MKGQKLLVSLIIVLLSAWAFVPSQTVATPQNPTETNSSTAITLDPKLKEIDKDSEEVSHYIIMTSSPEGTRIKNLLHEMDDVEITSEFNFIDGVSVKASRNAVEKIKHVKGVTAIWKDRVKHVLGFPSRDYDEYTFHADTPVSPDMAYSVGRIEAPSVWKLGYEGENVTIAVLDTGIAWDHETFFCYDENGTRVGDTKVIANVSFVPWEENGYDLNGHGTHCAGIAAGTGGPSGKYRGVAPEANLVSVKIGCSEGYGYDSWIIGGIEWVIKNKDICNIKIISFSFGGPGFPEDPLSMAINRAVEEGILFSAAAGNEGPDWGTVHGPGWAVNAITVGATTKEDTIWEFSSRGPIDPYGSQLDGYPAVATPHQGRIEPDIVAPGVNIMSADAWDPAGYVAFSGTSMSTPHVAGAAAVLLSAFPSATPEMIRVALTVSATDLGHSPNEQGDGRLNLGAAYDAMVTLGNLGVLSWEELGAEESLNSTGLNHVLGKNTYFYVMSNNTYAEYSNAGVTEPWAFMGGTVGAVIDEYGRIGYDYIYSGGYTPETLHCVYWRFHVYYNDHGLSVTDCTPIVEYVNYNFTYIRVTKWLLTPFNDAVVGVTWIFNGTYAEYWKNIIQVSATIMSVDGSELENVGLAWVNGYNYDPFDAEPYLEPYRTSYDTATNTMIITPLNHMYTPRTHEYVDDTPTIAISSSLEPFGYSACNQRHGWDLIWYTPGPWDNETGPVIGQVNSAVKWTFGNVSNATAPITFGIGVNQSVAMEMSEKGKTMPSYTPHFPEWGPDVRVELKGQVVTANSTEFELVVNNPSSIDSSRIDINLGSLEGYYFGSVTISKVAAFSTTTSSIAVDFEAALPYFPEGFLAVTADVHTPIDVSVGDWIVLGEVYINCVPVVFGPGLYWHWVVGPYNGYSQECLLTVVTPIPMNITIEPFLSTFADTSVGLERVEAGLVFGPYIYDFTLYSNTTTSFEDMEIIGLQANEHWIAWHVVWCHFESGYGGNAMPVIADVSLSDTVISLMEDTLLITAEVSDLETPPQDLIVLAEILYLDWYGYTYMPRFSYSDQSYISYRYIVGLRWNPAAERFEGSVAFTTPDAEAFFEGLYGIRILVIDHGEIVDSPVKQFRIDDKPSVFEAIKLDERIMDVGSVKPAADQFGFVYPRPVISAAVGLAYEGIPEIQILVTSTLALNLSDVDFEGINTSDQLTVIAILFDYQTWSPILVSNVTYNNATQLYELHIELPMEALTYVGVYELDIFVIDTDGSVSATWFPVRITVDTTKPVVEITSPSADTVVAGNVTVTFIATDKNLQNVTYSIDGGAPVNVTGETSFTLDTTTLPDGRHVITLTATDVMGLQSSTSLPLIIDNTPPTLSIVSPENNTVVSGVVDVTFVAWDAELANASLVIDAGTPIDVTGTTSFALNTTEILDGPHTIKLLASDLAGNDAAASITIVVDNTSPTAALISPAEDSFVSGTVNVTFSFSDDNLESATLLLDGKMLSDITNKTFYMWNATHAADGDHILTLIVMDRAGNSETIERTVKVDNTSPTAEIREPAENAYLRGSYGVVIYGYDANLDVIELYINESPVASWEVTGTHTYTWNTTEDDTYTIKLLVKDKAGNNVTDTVTVIVDNTVPTATFISPATDSYIAGTVNVTFSFSDYNLDTATLILDGKNLADVTRKTSYEWDITHVVDGKHTLTLMVEDKAGNTKTVERTITVDKTFPIAEIREPVEGPYVKGTCTVNIYGYDANFDIMKLYIDGVSVENWTVGNLQTYPWDTTTLDEGSHTIKLIVNDKAGNSITVEIMVIVDNTKPVVNITNAAELNGTELTGTVTINFTATDMDIANVILYIDNVTIGVAGKASYEWDTTMAGDGTYKIKLVAYDEAGNMAETDPITVTTVNVKRGMEATRNLYLGVGTPIGFIIGAIVIYAVTRKRPKSPPKKQS